MWCLDGIVNQLGGRSHPQLFHHPVFVKGHRPRREIQHAADLLHRRAFSEQLQDFALPRRQLVGGIVARRRCSSEPTRPSATSGVM